MCRDRRSGSFAALRMTDEEGHKKARAKWRGLRLVRRTRPTLRWILPNLRPVLGLHPHRVAFLDAEGVVELLQVHQRAEGTEATRRMRVDRDEALGLAVAHVGAPHLRPGDEEALLRREAVDQLALLALQRTLEGLIG